MPSARFTRHLQTVVSIFLIAGTGLLASGCGTAAPTTGQTSDIRVWRYNVGVDPFRDTIRTFQKAYPQANVSYQSSFGTSSYELTTLSSLASRTGPEIWSYPSGWVGDEQDRVAVLPDNFYGDPAKNNGKTLAGWLKELYPADIASQLTTTDGKVLGLASNVDTLRVYVNPDALSNSLSNFRRTLGDNYKDSQYDPVRNILSGAPTTWDQLLKQIPYLTVRSGTTITQSAIALGTADNIPDSDAILQLLMFQNGAEIVNSDRNRSAFSNQQTTPSGAIVRPGEKALSFYAAFSNPSNAAYTWNPSLPQAVDAFGQGKVAMVIGFSDFGAQVKNKYPRLAFDTAAVPQISGTAKPVTLSRFTVDSVTKVASSIPLSEQLLYALESRDASGDLANSVGLRSPWLKTLQGKDDFQSKAILNTRVVYKKHHTDFDAAFQQMIRDVSQNGSTASGAIDQGSTKIDALLTQAIPSPSTNFNASN